jgi:hypothetical protein
MREIDKQAVTINQADTLGEIVAAPKTSNANQKAEKKPVTSYGLTPREWRQNERKQKKAIKKLRRSKFKGKSCLDQKPSW